MKVNKEIYKFVIFFSVSLILFGYGTLSIKDLPTSSDENVHAPHIARILNEHNLFLKTDTSPLPGYHWTMAFLAKLVHSSSATSMRFSTSFLSFFCLIAFVILARKIDNDAAFQKSCLFLIFPLIFPFFFLIYTDVYSMFYVFLALWAALDQRLWLSGIFGILSIFVRQNNIVWLVFVGLLAYFQNYYPQHRWQDIKHWLPKFFFFFLGAVLLTAFAIWNKGLVLGQRELHPLSLNFGNLFFFLFIFFFLFLPQNLKNFPKIVAFLKRHKIMWLILIELFLIYYLFFNAKHPYNRFGRFIHNWILFMMTASLQNKILTFLPIAYAVLSLCVTRLQRASFYLFYPFTILFLIPLPIIEIRYLFIPFSFFLLFKEKDSERITFYTLAINSFILFCLMFTLADGSFFP